MTRDDNSTTTLLSKWWTTQSCQAAFERAAIKRRERINQVRAAFAAKQEALVRAVDEWQVAQ
jgi:hypothetical protein